MATAIPDGRKVHIEEDDGTIRTEVFHDENVAYSSAQAIELLNDDDGPLTLSEFKRRWEHYHARLRLTPETLADYERHLEPVMDELGDLPIDQVRDEAYAYYRQRIRAGDLGGLHPAMSRLSALHGIARKWGYTNEPAISVAELMASSLRTLAA